MSRSLEDIAIIRIFGANNRKLFAFLIDNGLCSLIILLYQKANNFFKKVKNVHN